MSVKIKTVFQLDNEGYFIGETIAYESPQRPDTYLIPGGCVETVPPTIPDGKKAKWVGDIWILEDIPDVVLVPDPETIRTPLQLAEQWVANSFSSYQLLQMKDWWDNIPHENVPKLSAVYSWIRNITQLAALNTTEFPNTPHPFEEIIGEVLPLLNN